MRAGRDLIPSSRDDPSTTWLPKSGEGVAIIIWQISNPGPQSVVRVCAELSHPSQTESSGGVQLVGNLIRGRVRSDADELKAEIAQTVEKPVKG